MVQRSRPRMVLGSTNSQKVERDRTQKSEGTYKDPKYGKRVDPLSL